MTRVVSVVVFTPLSNSPPQGGRGHGLVPIRTYCPGKVHLSARRALSPLVGESWREG
ncbi:hypothetical protein KL86PLE_100626 [uncultured Pleomorphomonas sp.]|uniref:Uncharacterized protein n=1 Tax=uncultured Pleomorphomonas sp. TaxID=442121 RepID=A0A212L4V0_9HYPH|nr:hypothetical protein KL86PLE_100626 [uncultured Pleomorphomonas sp.]